MNNILSYPLVVVNGILRGMTIDHDSNCGGCATNRKQARHGGSFVFSDLAYCARCGPTRSSSSYLHRVEGKRYCWNCADIMARARNERVYVAAMYGVGITETETRILK